ncbi:MFS general substrate transporter [Xylariaceae sp. FL0255]|nr:MFS general substrate transporter [Xylariaceae sp. FL0255]
MNKPFPILEPSDIASGSQQESVQRGEEQPRASTSSSHKSSQTHHSSSIDTNGSEHEDDGLDRVSTRHTVTGDSPIQPVSSVIEVPDDFYNRLPPHRKRIIVILLSFCSFLAPISSTSVLAATPEVAKTYSTTGTIVNLVNALYLLFMGLSPIVWGPLSQVYGRRIISLTTGAGFFVASIGTALSPNLASFFFFRLLTGFEGTSFLLTGAAVISDIYRPTERGTATGWYMCGTLIGPAFGPFLGGIIVTYTSWRGIFWLQTALGGIAALGVYFLLPETIFHMKKDDLQGLSGIQKGRVLFTMINPWRVLKLFQYPNIFLAGLASSSLVWNMYSLLTPIRYVLNPRYHLTSPLLGGLFYLAPGLGYLAGSFVGGRYADYMVKKYIKKRGVRIPEDRLNSALPAIALVIPASVLIYGWSVEKDVGGIPLTVIVLFLQAVAQLFCFPSLNTYCLDVMSGRSAEVIAGNYAIRYLFSCVGTAVVLPAIDAIGVGWFSTISTFFVLFGALCTFLTARYGRQWREAVDARHKQKKLRKMNSDSSACTEKTSEQSKGKAGAATYNQEPTVMMNTPSIGQKEEV